MLDFIKELNFITRPGISSKNLILFCNPLPSDIAHANLDKKKTFINDSFPLQKLSSSNLPLCGMALKVLYLF